MFTGFTIDTNRQATHNESEAQSVRVLLDEPARL